jgi:hypothetical protein
MMAAQLSGTALTIDRRGIEPDSLNLADIGKDARQVGGPSRLSLKSREIATAVVTML